MKIRLFKSILTSETMRRLYSEYRNIRIVGTVNGYLEVHMETDYINPDELNYLMTNFDNVAFVGNGFIMEELEDMEHMEDIADMEEDCIDIDDMEELYIEEFEVEE